MAVPDLYLKMLILWLSLCLLSCTQPSSQSAQAPFPILFYHKAPCYGPCPSYKATILSDGSVTYEGFKHTPLQGQEELKLTAKQTEQILTLIGEVKYDKLKDYYPSPYTDQPTTNLAFFKDGKEVKRIKHQHEGPDRLQALISYVDEVITERAQSKSR